MKTSICILFLAIISGTLFAQRDIYPFYLQSRENSFEFSPVQLHFEGINFNTDSFTLKIFRIDGKNKTEVPSQIEWGISNKIWFFPGVKLLPGKKISFQLEIVPKNFISKDSIVVIVNNKTITIKSGDKNVLSYSKAITEAPEGTDYLYRRSGYIHPLWSPSGKILTSIQPKDHLHHYGIWNPWTKVKIGDKEVDFWNLASGQGTVRFAGLISSQSGNLLSGFKVRHEHVDFTSKGEDKISMDEVWDVNATPLKINNQQVWLIDFNSLLCNAIDTTIILEEYRYGGGIGFRATELWGSSNSSLITSEDRTRDQADASLARWCNIKGETGTNHQSGITFYSHPLNFNHPEPMRVWPSNQYEGKSNMFFEFSPIRNKSLKLEPNKPLVFRYRILVYDNEIPLEIIEQLWKEYAVPPKVTWQ